jgi:chitodextrinase
MKVHCFLGRRIALLGATCLSLVISHATDNQAPTTPTGLTASAVSSGQINLSWTPSTDRVAVAGYHVYRNGTLLTSVTTTAYSSLGLSPLTSYCYTVDAYDAAGNVSSQSASACATTPADTIAPSVPTLTVSAASSSQINLSWTASTDTGGSGFAGYKIYRSGVLLTTTTATSYSNTGLAASTSYCYTVAAYDNAGNNSAQSTSKCATTSTAADTTAPSVPTLSVSAASSSQINLSWTASTDTGGSGLAGYKIYRSGVLLTTTTATSYSNTGLAANTSYCYTVAAYDNAGNNSAQSISQCATTTTSGTDTIPPSVPTLTATAASSSQINLSWTASTDTGGSGLRAYQVYRGGVLLVTTSATSYSNTGLTAGSTYCYTVLAYDNAGNNSAQSASQCATTSSGVDGSAPSVPTLTVSAASSSQINLSWTASTDTGGSGLAGYKIYRAGVLLTTTTATSYSNTGLAATTSYCYTVAAYDNAGNNSAQSASQCATTTSSGTDTTPPSVPTLTVSAASSSQINLSWTASTDNVGGSGLRAYQVYRSGVLLATVTGTSYSNTGLAAGTTYCYTVLAYDNAGNNSAQSASQCATTSGGTTSPPPVPTLSASGASSSQINLSWTASTGATGYKIYRAGVQIGTATTPSYSNTGLSASTTYCYTVAAYDSAGNTSAQSASQCATTLSTAGPWVKTFGNSGADEGTSVACDSSGNIIIGGAFSGSVDFGGTTLASAGGKDIFIAKYSSSGTLLWAKRFGGAADDEANGVAVDSQANIFLTGQTSGSIVFGANTLTSLGGTDVIVAKLDSSGNPQWSSRFGDINSDVGTGIAVDPSGNVVITGYFEGSVNFGSGLLTSTYSGYGAQTTLDTFLLKLSGPTGACLWSKALSNTTHNRGQGVAVDSQGDILLTGCYQGSLDFIGGWVTYFASVGSYDVYVAKFSGLNGNHIWSKSFGGTDSEEGLAICADPTTKDVVVTGYFRSAVNFGGGSVSSSGGDDIFLVKLNGGTGAYLWSKNFGSPDGDRGQGLRVDNGGNVILTGFFADSVDFGGGPRSSGTVGMWNLFAAKFTSSGTHVWSDAFGGNGNNCGRGVAVDGSGNVDLTGAFQATINFNGVSVTAKGLTDIFLLQLDP